MPKFNFGGLVDAVAYGALDEILGMGRSNDGIAKPSRYEVTLFPPSGQQGSRGQSNNIFSKIMGEILGDGTVRATGLKCEAIELPGRTIDTTPDGNVYGPERQMATGYTFTDITATFQCSSDLKEKKYFETWQRLTFNPKTFAMGYYDDYIGSVDIHTLDEQNKRRYGIKLMECFPKTIGAQSLSYAGTGYLTVPITLSYRYWINLTDEAQAPNIPLSTRIAERAVNTVTRRITSQIPSVLRRL